MIALIFASALLFDATPKEGAAFKTAHATEATPVADLSSAVSSGPILTSVAVTLECTAHANGQVDGCVVLGETHPGLGFGDAAIALMRDAEVDPGPRDVQFARTIQFMP